MKAKMMAVVLVLTALSLQSVLAAEYREKTQYLGVVNGQVVGNSVVKVTRTPPEPVLYRNEDASFPESLVVRNAVTRAASGGMAYITVKQALPDNGEARITLKAALMVDGQKIALQARQQGEDVLIMVPEAIKSVELRTDAQAELEVPASYRGNIQIALQVEESESGQR